MKLRFAAIALVLSTPAGAQSILWGNNAQFGTSAAIESFSKSSGVRTNIFAGFPGSSINGRGIVVVGNTVYYTVTDDNRIHRMDATTGADMGFITTTQASMSTIAWDGSQFWTSDYSGSNQAYRIDLSGTTTSTINLANASGNSDGMEWFNGKLIANRSDGGSVYDIYDLNGNVLVNAFINTGEFTTGIAYDGTNFYVSKIFSNSVGIYSGTTGAFLSDLVFDNTVPPYGQRLLEDLSVDYEQRIDTATTPEPATLAMLAPGLLAAFVTARRRRKSVSLS